MIDKAVFINKQTIKNQATTIVMTKQLFLLIVLVFSITLIAAEVENFGTFKQGSCVILKQTCSNCTYSNLTSVLNPVSQDILGGQKVMTSSNNEYTYNCINVTSIGKHIVNGFSNVDGTKTVWAYEFEVTPSGFQGTLGFSFLIVTILAAIAVLGFTIKDGWFVVFSGLGLIGFGIYSFINGIAGFKDTLVTQGTALFFIGIGAYLAINSGIQMIDEGFE
jgi:hypothetical protein